MNPLARASVPHLMELGFTEIEAAAYAFLVQASPATGYRVAQGIGKPVANTYKALQSLRQMGAIVVDGTATRRCRAVPPGELLAQLEERRRMRVAEAQRALARIQPTEDDDGVYALATRAQAVERFREMLARATEVALIDVFPQALAGLRAPIEATARRGVQVAMLVYEPVRIRGAEVVLHHRGAEILARWPGEWFNLVIDGTEHMLAFFAERGSQAMWSCSPYLSWIYHGGLYAEMTAARLTDAIERGAPAPELSRIARRMQRLVTPQARGYRQLRRRLAPPPAGRS